MPPVHRQRGWEEITDKTDQGVGLAKLQGLQREHVNNRKPSRHRDLPFEFGSYFLDHSLAELFVKENRGSISRLLSPVSKFRQARHSGVLGKVEGEKLVPIIGFREADAGTPVLAVYRVQERVVLQFIPPRWGRSFRGGPGVGQQPQEV